MARDLGQGPKEAPHFLPNEHKRPKAPRALPRVPRHWRTRSARAARGLTKTGVVLVAILVVVVTAKWVLGGANTGGGDPTQQGDTGSTAATLDQPAAPAAPVDDDKNSQAEAGATGDDAGAVDPDPFGLTITPASGLVDGQEIQFSAALTPDDATSLIAQICASGNYTACTQLSPVSVVLPSDEVAASLTIPRRFNTLTGDIHDCVADSPCDLLVWFTPLQNAPAIAPLDFDPTAAVRPIEQVGLVPEGPYNTTDSVIVVSEDVTGYDLLQCVVSEDARCEALPRETQPSRSGVLLDRIATLHRNINTPSGSHDCILDGPCELRVVPWTNVLVHPVPLEFDPDSALEPSPEVIVRPSVNLDDGELVEIRVAQVGEIEPFVALCRVGTSVCLSLGEVATPDGTGTSRFRLPRHFSVAPDAGEAPVTVDCGGDNCELRIQGARSSRNVAIDFDPTAESRPLAEILLGEATPLFPTSVTTVRGRDFLVIDPDNPPWVELILCPSPESELPASSCGRLRNSPSIISADGTFTAQITLPASESSGRLLGIRDLCTPTCRILAGADYEGYGDSAVWLDIEVQAEPG